MRVCTKGSKGTTLGAACSPLYYLNGEVEGHGGSG
jgi:hypothetical protein